MRNRPPRALFELLPQHLRNRDAEVGRPLEALAGLFADELQIVEQDIDQLYDNWFIETCEPWAVPYIAALVGARGLRDIGLGEAGLRSFIANTLGYRQAKGTAAALEQMARDVTGWPMVAVEFFQRLVWSQNVNHVRPEAPGFASVRDAEAARAAHGPFETACHVAGAGPAAGWAGRYNLPNIGLFVWRLDAYPLGFLSNEPNGYLGGPQPRASQFGAGLLHFDPLGADRPLHNRPKADTSIAARVDERVVPAPLDRRRLHRDLNALRAGVKGAGRWFDDLPVVRVRLDGSTLPPQKLFCCNLEARPDGGGGFVWERPANAGEILFDPELGRLSLHPADEAKAVETVHAYAAPFDIGGGPYDRTASVEEWRGDFFPEAAPPPWRIGVSSRPQDKTDDPDQGGPVVESLVAAIQRWNAAAVPGMRGIITILDNASYATNLATPTRTVLVPPGARLAIVAASWPLAELGDGRKVRDPRLISPIHRRPHVQSNVWVAGEAGGAADEPGTLILDGLLVEGEVAVRDGALGRLDVRHSTLGASAAGLAAGIRVVAGNEALTVALRNSIVGKVAMSAAAGGLGIFDSIVGEDRLSGEDPDSMNLVVVAPAADLELARSTLFGRCQVRSIEAENGILVGRADAAHRQSGCVRFCFAPLSSRVPRRYRCAPDLSLDAEAARLGRDLTAAERVQVANGDTPRFTDSRFTASAFGQLASACPAAIRTGAEGGAEMGAGFGAGEPFRRANLADAMQEYLPFGLEAATLFLS
jgi:hypothetical protein